MTPGISVLLPTRKRLDHLRESVSSLVSTAADPASLEYLFYTDEDDSTVLFALPDLRGADKGELRGARLGYENMHVYYNTLASRARGKLLFIWNDDTRMLTPRWDALLLDKAERPLVQCIRRDTGAVADDTFPVVDRRIFAAVGHLALHCYVDSWLGRVATAAGVQLLRNDIVFHHHRLSDQVQDDNSRAVNGPEGHAKFFTMDAQRAEDVRRIRAMLERVQP